MMLTTLFCVISGYLIGSICSAVIVSRIFSLPDPCQEGSLNPGATNVLRLAGKKYAILVLLADVLKGVLPVLFAKIIGVNTAIVALTGLAAVLGHIFPVFFGFKGGKGVATALGVLFGLNAMLGMAVVIIWLLTATISRYSSLASITSIALSPLLALLISTSLFIPLGIIAAVVIYKHATNIKRLKNGTEPTINLRKKTAMSPETTKQETDMNKKNS